MSRILNLLLVIIISAATSYATARYLAPASQTASQEDVYARVLRTGVIRCGYAVWPPDITRDPATGQMGGIFYDLSEEVAKRLSLKVDWTAEVGWGDIPVALADGKIDAYCAGPWPSAKRARAMEFSDPAYFDVLYVWARADDTRFDQNLFAANSADIKFAGIDGTSSLLATQADFPKAALVTLPGISSIAEVYMTLASRKADLAISDVFSANEFLRTNPGTIKRVSLQPVRAFAAGFGVGKGQEKFKEMLNITMGEMQTDGTMDKILQKYEKMPSMFFRVGRPYDLPKN